MDMLPRAETQRRLLAGERHTNRANDIVDQLCASPERNRMQEKALNMLLKLDNLKEQFLALYPEDCLYQVGRKCSEPNKGTPMCCYPCLWKVGIAVLR